MYNRRGVSATVWAVLIIVAVTMPAAAQDTPRRFRFDIGTGVLTGRGAGVQQQRSGFSAAAQLSVNAWSNEKYSLLAGVNLSTFSYLGNTDDCRVPISNPTGGCLAQFPGATAVAAVIGVERRLGANMSFRLVAGPSTYTGYKKKFGVGASGGMSRLDFTVPIRAPVAFVAWGQAGVMPVENKPNGVPFLYGIGLRVQQ